MEPEPQVEQFTIFEKQIPLPETQSSPKYKFTHSFIIQIVKKTDKNIVLEEIHVNTETRFNAIPYLTEWTRINEEEQKYKQQSQQSQIVQISEQFMEPFTLNLISDILKATNNTITKPYKLPEPYTIEDSIHPKIYKILKNINIGGLQRLYKAVSFLGMKQLKQNVLMMIEQLMIQEQNFDFFEKKAALWGVKWQFNYNSLQTLTQSEQQDFQGQVQTSDW